MIELEIGDGEKHSWSEMNPGRLREAIQRRRNDGAPATVEIHIHGHCIDLTLRIPSSQSPGPPPKRSRAEEQVMELCKKFDFNSDDFPVGQLVAFLNQLKNKFDC